MPRKPTGNPIGRPPSANPKSAVFPVRLTASERQWLIQAADLEGVPVSQIIREAAVNSARRRIRQ